MEGRIEYGEAVWEEGNKKNKGKRRSKARRRKELAGPTPTTESLLLLESAPPGPLLYEG